MEREYRKRIVNVKPGQMVRLPIGISPSEFIYESDEIIQGWDRDAAIDRSVRKALRDFGVNNRQEAWRECMWMLNHKIELAFANQVRKNFREFTP